MKEVKTRFDEVKFRTSDVTKMQGMYLAESVYQTWTEDMLDETTGEVKQVSRSRVLFGKGAKVTPDIMVQIQIYRPHIYPCKYESGWFKRQGDV